MSFSNTMKADLGKIIPKRKCCVMAELIAMLKTSGSITIEQNKKKIFRLSTENVNAAKKFYQLVKGIFNIYPAVTIRKSRKLKEHNVFIISIDSSMMDSNMFFEVYMEEKNSKGYKGFIKNNCCKKAFLRGVFLLTGSVTNPNNCYHLEMTVKDIELAETVSGTLKKLEINAKIAPRKSNYIVYIKDSEKISAFLSIIGAHKALLDLENVRILKEMRNNVNRIVNCETANISKIVDASVRHIENIKYLMDINQLEKLPDSLREIALLRLQYPDSSLKELGAMLDTPVGKSGVNHRLNKIDEIVEKLKNNS